MNKPTPRTVRSPNRSTNLPENKPDANRIIAKAEISTPIAVLLTPKEEAKIGIAGIIKPKPIATKKDTVERIATSFGISLNGFRLVKLMTHHP
jgi:hypothetical protein